MKKAKPSDGGTKKQFQIRISDEMETRINKYKQHLVKTTNLEVSFTTAWRSLVEKGLEAVKL
jgi:predicted DNA-binding protein